MSDLSEPVAIAWRAVESQWQQTRSLWRDRMGLEFEQRFWLELEQQTRELRAAAATLEESLSRALRCRD